MNIHIALPGMDETINAMIDLPPKDLALIAGLGLWLFMLAMPLRGIDRRDTATGFTYALFMTAAGVVLILAMPDGQRILAHSRQQLTAAISMSSLAILRWAARRRPRRYIHLEPED